MENVVIKGGMMNMRKLIETTTKKGNEEEEGMQRFVDYIRKQGLVIVDASTLDTNRSEDKRTKAGSGIQDNHSSRDNYGKKNHVGFYE